MAIEVAILLLCGWAKGPATGSGNYLAIFFTGLIKGFFHHSIKSLLKHHFFREVTLAFLANMVTNCHMILLHCFSVFFLGGGEECSEIILVYVLRN